MIESVFTTLNVNDLTELWFGDEESVTLMPAPKVPTVVAVPEILPVLALSVNPAGKAPDATDQV